jgi:hypothetical protein
VHGDDDIDGRGGADQMFGDGGDDLIHWDYADLTLGTVDGGAGTTSSKSSVRRVRTTSWSHRWAASSFKVANFKAGTVAGSITGKNFEDLRLDARAGADRITVDYMAGSGLSFVALSPARMSCAPAPSSSTIPESGQPIEQEVLDFR